MAIKKTTAVKKSDPPSKKKAGPPTAPTTRPWKPNAMIPGKDFGKKGSTGTYYYMEGQAPFRNQKDMPSLDGKRTIREVERQNEFNRMLTDPRRPIVTPGMLERYADAKKASAARAKSKIAAKARVKGAVAPKAKNLK
jgi:hypothetical protein